MLRTSYGQSRLAGMTTILIVISRPAILGLIQAAKRRDLQQVYKMPRGEADEFILLCSYEDNSHILHGLGLRKAATGTLSIQISSVERSSFSEQDGLIVSADVEEPRYIRVHPELYYVHPELKTLRRFRDSDDVKDAISLLLVYVLNKKLYITITDFVSYIYRELYNRDPPSCL